MIDAALASSANALLATAIGALLEDDGPIAVRFGTGEGEGLLRGVGEDVATTAAAMQVLVRRTRAEGSADER